jgi:hypothetical protein
MRCIASRTRALVSAGICGLSRSTSDTVARDTPLAAATSFMVSRAAGRRGAGGSGDPCWSDGMGHRPRCDLGNELAPLHAAALVLGDELSLTHDQEAVSETEQLVDLI